MYEDLFEVERARRKHEAHPWSKQLERFAQRLLEAEYKRPVVLRSLYSWEAFLSWTKRKKLPLAEIEESVVATFIRSSSRRRTWRGRKISADHVLRWHRPALGHLLRFMREEALIPPKAVRVESEQWLTPHLDELEKYLRLHRGASEAVVERVRREVGWYLQSLMASGWSQAMERISAASIDAFLLSRTESLKRSSRSNVAGALRTFFSYLYVTGQLTRDLTPDVPTVRQYRLGSIPKALPWGDVQEILRTVDRSTKAGKRDYAVLMLLCTYGLRGGEVVSLRIGDIDWRGEVLHIRNTKTRRPLTLPLVPEVGEAVIDYLKHSRPASSHRELFLGLYAPHAPLARGGVLRWRLMKVIDASGVETKSYGTHVFRHSRAVHLLNRGCSLKSIGDLLGHRDPISTFVYTKVHVEALRNVALDVEV
jgi:integrase/recombinase XerD